MQKVPSNVLKVIFIGYSQMVRLCNGHVIEVMDPYGAFIYYLRKGEMKNMSASAILLEALSI